MPQPKRAAVEKRRGPFAQAQIDQSPGAGIPVLATLIRTLALAAIFYFSGMIITRILVSRGWAGPVPQALGFMLINPLIVGILAAFFRAHSLSVALAIAMGSFGGRLFQPVFIWTTAAWSFATSHRMPLGLPMLLVSIGLFALQCAVACGVCRQGGKLRAKALSRA